MGDGILPLRTPFAGGAQERLANDALLHEPVTSSPGGESVNEDRLWVKSSISISSGFLVVQPGDNRQVFLRIPQGVRGEHVSRAFLWLHERRARITDNERRRQLNAHAVEGLFGDQTQEHRGSDAPHLDERLTHRRQGGGHQR
jgi:hypothetical protein